MPLKGNPQDWRVDTRQGFIYRDLPTGTPHTPRSTNGDVCVHCDQLWRRYVDTNVLGTAPMTYGKLGPCRERSRKCRDNIYEIHAYAAAYGVPQAAPEPIVYADPQCGGCANGECCQNGSPGEPCGCCGTIIPAIVAQTAPPAGLTADQRRYLAKVRELRTFAKDREIDHISYRPIADGMRMITAGISVEACLYAATVHWDETDRRQAGILPFDPQTQHPGGLDAYIRCLASARVLIYLHGPAGFGKSHWVKRFAGEVGETFAAMPCTEGATPSWLLGKDLGSGFKGTTFLESWVNGGAYLLDEIDAADPNLLMVINDALANDALFNPVDQTRYERTDRCFVFAAGNTLGGGADGEYNARNQLDFSTLDRFRMGRVYVGYDEDTEMLIALENAQKAPLSL